jgi:hypothetical protein
MAVVINIQAIDSKKSFMELICFNCGLCELKETKAEWCFPKFVENREGFVKYFVNQVITANVTTKIQQYTFRGPDKFKELFCSPDKGACYISSGCQGAMKRCYNGFYAQLIGLPNKYSQISGFTRAPHDYDKLSAYSNPIIDAEYTEVKDKGPFIFSSTGKRFLNRVEKILENRNKPKHRARKSTSKARAPAKTGTNNSKPTVSRGKKGR